MQIMLVHQNFPAQFRWLAPALQQCGHQVTAIGSGETNNICSDLLQAGIAYHQYIQYAGRGINLHPYTQMHALARSLHVNPEIVIAHSGWSEALYAKKIWPRAKLIVLPELWGSRRALGEGFDEEQPPLTDHNTRAISRQNRITARSILMANASIVPTAFQRASFPEFYRQRIQIIADGFDVKQYPPRLHGPLELPNRQTISAGTPIVTYVSRQFERLRGFQTLLEAVPMLLNQHPTLHILIIGGEGRGYGVAHAIPMEILQKKLQSTLDQASTKRVIVTGTVSHAKLCEILARSQAHIYLSYPYTLSWSCLEAMACGAPIITNVGGPAEMIVKGNQCGLFINFNDPKALAESVLQMITKPELGRRLGLAGKEAIARRHNIEKTTKQYESLFNHLVMISTSNP